ncbi:hypothetical protein F5Y04DRAFT_281995 [Hypomontagnella monticulosa]|nr:hypothetical protein F5Y04DRAFT_281995 [Hypomontagnella monticulosa]
MPTVRRLELAPLTNYCFLRRNDWAVDPIYETGITAGCLIDTVGQWISGDECRIACVESPSKEKRASVGLDILRHLRDDRGLHCIQYFATLPSSLPRSERRPSAMDWMKSLLNTLILQLIEIAPSSFSTSEAILTRDVASTLENLPDNARIVCFVKIFEALVNVAPLNTCFVLESLDNITKLRGCNDDLDERILRILVIMMERHKIIWIGTKSDIYIKCLIHGYHRVGRIQYPRHRRHPETRLEVLRRESRRRRDRG